MIRTIKKIRIQNNKIKIAFDEHIDGKIKECDIAYGETPRPEFIQAFNKLSNVACEVTNAGENDVNAIGIDFKYTRSSNLGAMILCEYYVERAGEWTTIKTPLFLCGITDGEHGLLGFFTEEQAEVIKEVEHEAQLYIQGERAQMKLIETEEQEEIDHLKQMVEAGKAAMKQDKAATPLMN